MAQPPRKRARLEFQEGDIAFKFLVTPNGASKLIGRGGAEIAHLRQEFGVSIHICEFAFPGTNQQIAIIGGPPASVNNAFGYIIAKLAEDEQAPRKGDDMLMSLVMSRNTVSKIIGTKGATISQLRQQSGCSVSADSDSVKGEQLLRISSADPNSIAGALSLVSPFVEESGDSIVLASQDYFDVAPGKGSKDIKGWAPACGGKGWAPDACGKGKAAWTGDVGGKGWAGINGGGKNWAPEGIKGWASEGGKCRFPEGGKVGKKGKAWAPDGKGKFNASAVSLAAAEPQLLGDGIPLESAPESPEILESPASIQFAIPSHTISRVLGKGGASAAEIRSLAGVTLKIDTNAQDGLVTLTGSVLGVHHAHCMVIQRVSSEY